jgi:homocysteine S-methyltransferase
MTRPDIRDRLASGAPLVLDGATGSELQRRGVWVSHGATAEKLGAWSATAMRDAPGIVRQVHEDYFKVGADIVTTNSFWTNSVKLGPLGLGDKAAEYTRRSGEIAVEARDRLRPHAYVAGGMAPPHGSRVPVDPVDLPREFAMQAHALKDSGVDLLLLEYIGSVADVVAGIDAVAPVGLPVMIGLRHVTKDGALQHGDTFDHLITALGAREVAAILLMCTNPPDISASLPKLRKGFAGPIGAYPNIGYRRSAQALASGSQWHNLDTTSYGPADLAADGAAWLEMGAQIIGGCCATTPAHIAALRAVVPRGD